MAPDVVDLFEAVDVHEEDGKPVAAALRRGNRLGQPIVEEGPIGQVGERIVERQLLEIFLVPCGGFPALAPGRE